MGGGKVTIAEKEERIFVLQVEEKDELRNIIQYCNGCTFWPCDEECINRKKPMTRREAINRIAKALCADDVMREGYYQMAEAVLKELLK